MRISLGSVGLVPLSILLGLSTPLLFTVSICAPAIAQTQRFSDSKAEADRLLGEGLEQFNHSQFEAALQSWQQALTLYQSLHDRQGEGKALGSLGNAYYSLGDYAKAIDYHEQVLAIARASGDRRSEGKALGNLGIAYYSLGDYAKAIRHLQE